MRREKEREMKNFPVQYEQQFELYFKQSLRKFYHPLFGFDIIKFDKEMKSKFGYIEFGYIEDDKTSCSDFVSQKFGKDAVELINNLIKL